MNLEREEPSFANINLVGDCNQSCFYCIGNDLQKDLEGISQLSTHFNEWEQFDEFLGSCNRKGIQQLYITGLNTDPLLYSYLEELLSYLQVDCYFNVGLRTNGQTVLTGNNMDIINMTSTCKAEAVGYAMPSHLPDVHEQITQSQIPDWHTIWDRTLVPYRISIVVNRFNAASVLDQLLFIREAEHLPEYVQLCRVCTEFRKEEFLADQECFDRLYDDLLYQLNQYPVVDVFAGTPIFGYKGLRLSPYIAPEKTTNNGWNYYTSGVISSEYWLIGGYLRAGRKS